MCGGVLSNLKFDPSTFSLNESTHEASGGLRIDLESSVHLDVHPYNSTERVMIMHWICPFFINQILLTRKFLNPVLQLELSQLGLNGVHPRAKQFAPFLLQALFSQSHELRKVVQKRIPFEGRSYVVVHARSGHGIFEGSLQRFKWLNEMSIEEGARSICRSSGLAACRRGLRNVVIVSDTREVNNEIRKGVMQTLGDREVFMVEGKGVHISRIRRRRKKTEKDRRVYDCVCGRGVVGWW